MSSQLGYLPLSDIVQAMRNQPAGRMWSAAFAPEASNVVPQFRVSIAHADGRRTERLVTGGTSVQHSIDAMDDAGIGGVARVTPAGWVTP